MSIKRYLHVPVSQLWLVNTINNIFQCVLSTAFKMKSAKQMSALAIIMPNTQLRQKLLSKLQKLGIAS